MSKSSKPRGRQLSRAQLKAYEARRAEEINRAAIDVSVERPQASRIVVPRRSVMMSRSEEMMIIKSDLRRLLLILAVMAVFLVIATIILR